ncbi:MAG: cysteine synthase A [Oscillospiraceae bacterium]|nr:cysteine synthase A [Oscillospiraceae bacterium]
MMKVYNDITELIGHTPLVRLTNYNRKHGLRADLLAKVEFFNPAASVKDRAALSLITDAEKRSLLRAGSVIIEPTSGNTGIGLAAVAATRGYRVVLTMPDSMSVERRKLLTAYGAELVLTEGKKGMTGAVEKAKELAAATPGSFIPSQFDNDANPDAHRRTTGPELWADTDGRIDIFVAGVGTGGTLCGTGQFLKSKNPAIRIVAVEPASSPLLSQGHAGPHGLQGIGANFVPGNYDPSVVDEIVTVTDADAFAATRELPRTDGLLVGITSGAAVFAAAQLAMRPENAGKCIVALLPDTGARYLSSPCFAGED